MRDPRTFQTEPLADMVALGRVTAGTAQLWMRVRRPGRLTVRWWPEAAPGRPEETSVEVVEGNDRDNTATVRLPAEGAAALAPLTRYRFEVRRAGDGAVVGEGGFETAPAAAEDTPPAFAIGLTSCHQPFDEHGRVLPEARAMLRAVHRCLQRHDARFVLMVGDQMYADHPPACSLFDPRHFAAVGPAGYGSILECPSAEVRRLYQQRYRHFWSLPELQAIQAAYPCYMVLDDHDVVNNWGSNPAHAHPPWSTLGEGALAAYHDYQAARVLPPEAPRPGSFHFAFAYGHTAGFVMDLRTTRRAGAGGRLFAEAQLDDLQAFLAAHGDRRVLVLVLSVPMVHVSRPLARLGTRLPGWGEDFSDRWSSEAHVRDRDRLLKLIHAHQHRHPEQQVLLVSGDIHIGCLHRVRWPGGGPAFYQMVSSPLTHASPRWVAFASKQFLRMKRRIATHDGSVHGHVEEVRGVDGCARNLYGGLNAGVIEIRTPSPGARPEVRFHLYGHRGAEPVCVYRSPVL